MAGLNDAGDWAGVYLNLPLKSLDLVLRLPPLYVMDQLLLSETGVSALLAQLFGQETANATLVATSNFDGQKVLLHVKFLPGWKGIGCSCLRMLVLIQSCFSWS